MSESRIVGDLDAKRKRDAFVRKASVWPWLEFERLPDGSERGIEGYLYTPFGADFQLKGVVRWYRSADAIAASKFCG
jgi:hypothetical protein